MAKLEVVMTVKVVCDDALYTPDKMEASVKAAINGLQPFVACTHVMIDREFHDDEPGPVALGHAIRRVVGR